MSLFSTNVYGEVFYNQDHLISGDPLYTNQAGLPSLPIGTITIEEIKAPEGYLRNEEIFICHITPEGTTENVHTYKYPMIVDELLTLEMRKVEAKTGLPISNAEFIYTRPNGEVETFITDEEGFFDIKGLEYGTHKIKEIAAPECYLLNENEIVFAVSEENQIELLSDFDETMGNVKFDVLEHGRIEIEMEDLLTNFWLPETGSRGIGFFVLLGAVICGISTKNIKNRKRSH